MTKQIQVNDLLHRSREVLLNGETNNGLCYDGIVNEALYQDVVVLLKETNGNDANGEMPEELSDWNYCRWLKDQQADNKPEIRTNKNGEKYEEVNVFYHSTFRKLCYWLSLLFDTLENDIADPNQFVKNGQVDVETVRKVLNRVAVVNLKKTWGSSQTDSKALEQYVAMPEIKSVLREQMDILSPKIVLCCSPTVYWLAAKIYAEKIDSFYKVSSQSIRGKTIEFFRINHTVYVNFYHPQYYGKTDVEFSNYAIETFAHLKGYLREY